MEDSEKRFVCDAVCLLVLWQWPLGGDVAWYWGSIYKGLAMTKAEVLIALGKGKRVRHTWFSEGEWLEKELELYVFEDGVTCEPSDFWRYRRDVSWLYGWSVIER